MSRIVCVVIGYICGSFLTARWVVRYWTGQKVSQLGSGNPGMANVMEHLGYRPGILVLMGDVGKTAVAAMGAVILFPELGRIAVLYAGIGATIGHMYPFVHPLQGGKGVATNCMTLMLFAPFRGLLSNVVGMIVVLLTGYLPLGAVVISVVFVGCMLETGQPEAAVLSVELAVLMATHHMRGLARIFRRREPRKIKINGNREP